jgi:hypothetical protein
MDWNLYVMEKLVEIRVDEARMRSAHAAVVASLRPRRVDALAALGLGLIKLGRFVQRQGGVKRRLARGPALRMLGSRHI